MGKWQLQHAKARLSELVKRACVDGPQEITLHGKSTVIVLSLDDFNALKQAKPTLASFMQASPIKGVRLGLGRDKSHTRVIDL